MGTKRQYKERNAEIRHLRAENAMLSEKRHDAVGRCTRLALDLKKYYDRFTWLTEDRTHGQRGVAYVKDFGGPGKSYWPTEYGGRPVVGFQGKTYNTPEAAVDAALDQTPAQRTAAEQQDAEARAKWEKNRREVNS